MSLTSKKKKGRKQAMAFFHGNLLSKDGAIVAKDIEFWVDVFYIGHTHSWDGRFEVPVITPLMQDTYRIELADGRQVMITKINVWIRGDNMTVYFEGKGPFQ